MKVCGIGIRDCNSVVQVNEKVGNKYKLKWICPFYLQWKSVLSRCSLAYQAKHSHYSGTSVTPEWHRMSVFVEWMKQQPYEGMALDKDTLGMGDKVYGPERCLFVPTRINSLLTAIKSDKGDHPVGVSMTSTNKFVSRVHTGNGESRYLGRFVCEMEAHRAWQVAKADVIDETVQWWANDPTVNHTFRQDAAEALWQRADQLRADATAGVETKSL